jgi:hypothetical protein
MWNGDIFVFGGFITEKILLRILKLSLYIRFKPKFSIEAKIAL